MEGYRGRKKKDGGTYLWGIHSLRWGRRARISVAMVLLRESIKKNKKGSKEDKRGILPEGGGKRKEGKTPGPPHVKKVFPNVQQKPARHSVPPIRGEILRRHRNKIGLTPRDRAKKGNSGDRIIAPQSI